MFAEFIRKVESEWHDNQVSAHDWAYDYADFLLEIAKAANKAEPEMICTCSPVGECARCKLVLTMDKMMEG